MHKEPFKLYLRRKDTQRHFKTNPKWEKDYGSQDSKKDKEGNESSVKPTKMGEREYKFICTDRG